MLTGPAMRLFAILARAALFLLLRGRRRRWTPGRRRAPGRRPIPAPEAGSVIAGKAWVTDGDGLRVSGHRVRFAGLDAPELDQWAKHGGLVLRVTDIDQYGRVLGRVTCDGKDVGAWLVRNGHAIAAYSDRYKDIESEARREKRGLWSHEVAFDPRDWRRKQAGRG